MILGCAFPVGAGNQRGVDLTVDTFAQAFGLSLN